MPAFARLPAPARRSILHALGKYAPWEDGFDPTPPRAEPGEVTGPPDFVGIGVQKAGTTWWYDAVCAHPDVFSRADIHKERHFFGRYATRPFGPQECSLYHEWFPRPSGRLTGEWTPDYIHLPWVPALLARAAPRLACWSSCATPSTVSAPGSPTDGATAAGSPWRPGRRGSNEGSTTSRCTGGSRTSHPSRSSSCSTSTAWPTRPGSSPAPTASWDWSRSSLQRWETGSTRRATLDVLDDDVRGRLIELYSQDVRALATHFPDLDLSAWPNFSDLSAD